MNETDRITAMQLKMFSKQPKKVTIDFSKIISRQILESKKTK